MSRKMFHNYKRQNAESLSTCQMPLTRFIGISRTFLSIPPNRNTDNCEPRIVPFCLYLNFVATAPFGFAHDFKTGTIWKIRTSFCHRSPLRNVYKLRHKHSFLTYAFVGYPCCSPHFPSYVLYSFIGFQTL